MRAAIFFSVTCLGVSSMVTQILNIREFLTVFSGNELVIGIILGNWLLLTGIGSLAGRYGHRISQPVRWLLFCQVLIALLPPVQIGAVRMLKTAFLPGLMLGMGETYLASLMLLAPYCLVSGFLLTLFSGMVSQRRDAKQIGDVYVIDTVGDIAGGLIFSLFLVFFLTPFQTTAFLLILNLAAAAVLSFVGAPPGKGLTRSLPFLAIMLLSLAVLWRADLEHLTTQAGFPGQKLLEHKTTAYGSLAVTRQGDQITVYENGRPMGTTNDSVAAEQTVHYALAQHPDPRVVLLVSGGLTGAHREAAKYPVERIDYVELDPAVLELAGRFAQAGSDPRVRMIAEDGRRLVRSKRGEYDAVLMDLPDPATAQLNRFYTVEFFSEVRRALRPGGVFSFSTTGAENYANESVRLLGSAVHRSLATVFPNVIVLPGTRQFFVASDQPLDYDIAARLRKRGIPTEYVREDYLRATLTKDRIAEAKENVSSRAGLNRDFFPVSYHAHLRYWLEQFGSGLLLPSLVLVTILIMIGALLSGSRRPVVAGALCSSAFAGMGLELVLLIAFQICYGYVYRQIGLIVTAFLIGIAVGATWSNRSKTDVSALMVRLDALLAAAALLLAPTLVALSSMESTFWLAVAPPVVFPLLNGIIGFLVGAQFPIAAKLLFRPQGGVVEETAGSLYAFDLLGACVGAVFISALCVPLWGVTGACYLIGGIKLLSSAALRIRRAHITRPLGEEDLGRTPVSGAVFAFAVVMVVFVGLGLLILGEDTNVSVYAFSFTPALHWVLVALMGWGILRAMDVKLPGDSGTVLRTWASNVYHTTKVSVFRWVNFIGFAVVVFFPIFRCYFKIPYIFCHVCPRQCAFGFLRPYLVPGALIMNLERQYWCFQACPIGTLHDCQARMGWQARNLRLAGYVAVAVLVFTAWAYFRIMWDLEAGGDTSHDWYTFFLKNQYSVSLVVITVAAVLLAMAHRLRRSFCRILCPVGTCSELILKLERALEKRGVSYG